MSNLFPEQRVNKNGVWSTKHVRLDMAPKRAALTIPSPLLPPQEILVDTPPPEDFRPYQLRPTAHHYYGQKFKPREILLKHLTERSSTYENNGVCKYSVTDVEAYEVLEVVSPKDALLLLDYGVRSASDAKRIMSDAGLTHLLGDHHAPARQALRLGIPAVDFITVFPSNSKLFRDDSQGFVDKVLSVADKAMSKKVEMGDGQSATTLQKLVDDDSIDIEHIRFIGVARFHLALDNDGALVNELTRMHAGTSLCSPDDIDEFIEIFGLHNYGVGRNCKTGIYTLAGTYGPDYVKGITKTQVALSDSHWYHELAEMRGYDTDTSIGFIAFSTSLGRAMGKMMPLSGEDRWLLFESGLRPSVIGRRLKEGMSAGQIIGVEKHGITPSLSNGWI